VGWGTMNHSTTREFLIIATGLVKYVLVSLVI
jgi:hypothetical protein